MSDMDALHDERQELQALRDESDHGGTRRIGGVRYDDWPAPDELDDFDTPTWRTA